MTWKETLVGCVVLLAFNGCKSPVQKCRATNPDYGACDAACTKDDGESCYNLAMYVHGHVKGKRPPKIDASRARSLFEKSCQLRFAKACEAAGTFYVTGAGGTAKDHAKARRLSEQGCKLGDSFACERLKTLK